MDQDFDLEMVPMSTSTFYGRKKVQNLSEAEEFVASCSSNDIDVVIMPPAPDQLTDEEDVDDDNVDSTELPADIPGTLEIFVRPLDVESQVGSDSEYDSSDNETLSSKRIKLMSTTKRMKKQLNRKDPNFLQPDWKKCNPNYSSWKTPSDGATNRMENVIQELKNLTPKDVFEKLVTEDILQHVVDQTLLYARQKNDHTFTLTTNELKNFLGILFLTGYHKLPRERLYWSLDEDLHVNVVSNCMSRNRFLEIKKYLHINDNTRINDDRMYKVRPLMEMLNKSFQQWGIFHQRLSIDEAMVRYYGHHSAKQFIRGKPVRFGYKNWMMCSDNGYCYSFDTYCGKSKDNNQIQQPLGCKVVLSLLQCVSEPRDHIVFFDNYFTGLPLLNTLKKQGFRATGTLRQNRTEKCPLISVKEMEKKKRAIYDSCFDAANELLLVRWNDNSVCTVATNYDSIEPFHKVKRWCRENQEKADMEQPNVFRTYNKGMGGVDSNDQGVNNYRIAVKGKKWYWVLITSMLNVAMVNAWKLHMLASDEKMDLLLFQRNVTRHYLRFSTKKTIKSRNRGTVPQSIAKDNNGHYPQKIANQRRCYICHARVRWQCKKCVVTLCIERNCFEVFHT